MCEWVCALWDVLCCSKIDRAVAVLSDLLVSAWLQFWEARDPALSLPIVMIVGTSFESDDATLANDHEEDFDGPAVPGPLHPSSWRLRCFLVGETVRSRRLFCLLVRAEVPDERMEEAWTIKVE